MMVTFLRLWWQHTVFGDFFGMLASTMISKICHQHHELVTKIRRQHRCSRPMKNHEIHTMNLNIFLNDDWASSPAKISSGSFILYFRSPQYFYRCNLYNSELDLELNFGPVLEYFDPWKPRDYRKIGIRSKFWPWLVSFMLATEPAMDNTLNCFNNYRSNLLSTQKLYTFDAKPNPDREIWNKIFHKFWIGVGIGSVLRSSRVLLKGFRLLDVQKWHLLSSDSIINTKTEGLYNIIVTP